MGFKRKMRKGIRMAFSFLCCGVSKNEGPSPKTEPPQSGTIQQLLLTSIQNQIEEQNRQAQLTQIIVQLIGILQQQFTNLPVPNNCIQKHASGTTYSQFLWQVSYQSSFKAQTQIASKPSLMVILPDKKLSMRKSSSSIFCLNNGNFGSYPTVEESLTIDRGIQINRENQSRLIQTNDSVNMDLFKMNLIRIMRKLKEHIAQISQLLVSKDLPNPQSNVLTMPRDVHLSPGPSKVERQGLEGQFLKARVRALNFAKFYKLGRKGDKKKKEKGI